MGHWSDTLVVFDTETTGLDTRHARIVTSYVGIIGADGETVEAHSWLADPGVVIPDQAAAVHGLRRIHSSYSPLKLYASRCRFRRDVDFQT